MASSTARMSAFDKAPIRLFKRLLSAAMIWSTIAFPCFPATVTEASPGYRRSTLLVNGMTTTRARFRFAASLLTMTAGRVLRNSLPTNGSGSNSTHQTSLRFIGHVFSKSVAPFQRFRFALPVGGHRPVSVVQRKFSLLNTSIPKHAVWMAALHLDKFDTDFPSGNCACR